MAVKGNKTIITISIDSDLNTLLESDKFQNQFSQKFNKSNFIENAIIDKVKSLGFKFKTKK